MKIISIDGNIGAGKSTLFHKLHETYKDDKSIIFLREPVDLWMELKDENNVNILENFYKDQKRYSFSFQISAYISRLALLKDAAALCPRIIVSERDLITDREVFCKMLYDDKKIEKIEYEIYLKWFDTFYNDFKTTTTVYVKTDPEICFERISKRSRSGEELIPLGYLQNCDRYHTDMINNTDDVVLIDGSEDMYKDFTVLSRWIEIVGKLLE
jgi:deoxyadenosine/deoxycytidine kinase